MTLEEFNENVTDMDSLFSWCMDNGYDSYFDEYFRSCDYDEKAEEDVQYAIEHYSWTDVRDWLNNLCDNDDYNWYRYDGTLDYVGIEDCGEEYEDLRHKVLDEALGNGDVVEEDEDEEDDEIVDENGGIHHYYDEPECVVDENVADSDPITWFNS